MSVNTLIDFIVKAENGGHLNWDAVYGAIRQIDRPRVPVSMMTVGDVLAWQDSLRGRYVSTAVGGPQFIHKTLAALVQKGIARMDDKFSEQVQRNMAIALMRGRGLDKYLSGATSAKQFANSLAREWASLPCVTGPKAGRSYYDGDGVNHALVRVEDFLAAVLAASGGQEPQKRVPSRLGWLDQIIAFLRALLGGKRA